MKNKSIKRWMALAALFPTLAHAQLIYQEGFNTDGAKANPPRYEVIGGAFFEPAQFGPDNGINPADQLGPVYWAHNFEVSFTGVPSNVGRRLVFAWDPSLASTDVSEDFWKLFDSTTKWLLSNKASATVVISPNAAAVQSLADRLTAAGHTVVDDDTSIPDAQLTGDLFIHGPGTTSPSRFAQLLKPVIAVSALDHDDMLTSSIGENVTFEPGQVTIKAPNHPAAGGKTGSFNFASGERNWHLIGAVLPEGSTTLATVLRTVPPTTTSLADVDALVSGAKPSDKLTETVAALDFSANSAGNWQVDNPVPGSPSDKFVLVAKGKLTVAAKAKYSFALGLDDGGRFRIDKNKNGLDNADNVITEDATGGHRIKYADTDLDPGTYDFEVALFNAGGAGDVELSVAKTAGGGITSALDSGDWELLGDSGATAGVKLSGTISATTYVPNGAPEKIEVPMMVLINSSTDTPPGAVFGGGPFVGSEGAGFFGGSGMNKFPPAIADFGGYRTVKLRPVNVAGKTNVKLTIAAAATFLDFETSDFLDVVVFPKGESSQPVTLAHFTAPSGAVKYFQDIGPGGTPKGTPRLGLRFQDYVYDVPAGATDLIVEIRAATTWWNEIVAFDNIRISSGAIQADPVVLKKPAVTGDNLSLEWTGGNGPFLLQGTLALDGSVPWIDLVTVTGRKATLPAPAAGSMYFRVIDGTGKTVKLFGATLTGAAERPNPVTTPGLGRGFLALDGTEITGIVYYAGLKGNSTASHIHGPADANASAGVMIGLAPGSTPGRSGTYFTLKAKITDAQKADIEAGRTYFNVHSTEHAPGEIRGQLQLIAQ